MSRISSASQSARRRLPSTTSYQPLSFDGPSTSSQAPPAFPDNYDSGSGFRSRLSTTERRERGSTPGGGGSNTSSRRQQTELERERGPPSGFSTSSRSRRHQGQSGERRGGYGSGWESTAAASESGMSGFSVLSAFPTSHGKHRHPYDLEEKRRRREKRRAEKESRRLFQGEERIEEKETEREDPTDSPLRRSVKWMLSSGSTRKTVLIWVAVVVVVKWIIGLGGYSGYKTPPLRGDFEAQRHWISLTSSSLSSLSSISLPFTSLSLPFYHPLSISNTTAVPIGEWYSHDLSYWGLDYPPLTAYHSFLLGFIARLSPSTAQYVTLRPNSENGTKEELERWEEGMRELEEGEGLKNWMRGTVIAGDVVLWMSAVAWYCLKNFGSDSAASGSRKSNEKAVRRTLVAALTIVFQPALILIDSGHFQYNSIMLALTLWSINAFQSGHDLVGSILFVASLGFKQMALYYAPGVFAYLLGKCLWLGGRNGLNLFLHLGLTVTLSFLLLFLPFLSPFPTAPFQALHRIFPFARGLFEDKVANFWCTLNVLIKLRTLASVETLARLSLGLTGLAVVPSTVGVVWISYRLGRNSSSASSGSTKKDDSTSTLVRKDTNDPAPTSHLLPHLLLTSSLSFFLFSFQVHEKSILLPLMPLTLLMGGREKGYGRLDWEWGVLLNNVAIFSMYPLLKKDGLTIQYFILTLFWNFLIGYNPFRLRSGSFVKLLSLTAYALILTLHVLEWITTPPPHLPDLFPVLNLTLSAGVFGLGWLWGGKRLAQESWAIGGF
ncbi:dolichyl-P-Glc:Man(9)GlcNAc(2)-PP-dolichol alpha-1,3-glucosyltransferase [Sporobolomyces salmoneus]|uniref:dolichyl-P-Glc:Man(9)GlcNAc(2)-PP-dolichol alpha-1,3-glucosyltransferase n=1 Tax=Sporobolomyces salmoneus TaxID=183962 RepID=UPI00316B5FEA